MKTGGVGVIERKETVEEPAIDEGLDEVDRLFRAKEAVQGEQLSAKELCRRCGITLGRLQYLKSLHLVSRARGIARYAYYTERHERQIRRAEGLARELGGLTKVLQAGRSAPLLSKEEGAADGEFSYSTERVYTLATGIKIVVPEHIGEIGSDQLSRLLIAAKDHAVAINDQLFERAFNRLEEGECIGARPKNKPRQQRPSPLPSP
ncbi:hypothetical protein [Roseateles noduli]|uniref:hypothetical protein n=1 Tax=Roseateles noduli TaxID=2052484 RepID=UPI003D64DBE0